MDEGSEIRGVLFDLDGTIYEGDALIKGAASTLATLSAAGIPYRFVTNTTSKPRSAIVEKLGNSGIEAPPDAIFTAPAVARSYLVQHGYRSCYFLLKPALIEDFEGVASVGEAPEAVVIGDLGDGFSYEKLNRAFRFLLEGAVFLTLARNRYFKAGDGLALDVGPFVAALEYATQREAVLLGKPAPDFFHAAVASMGIAPAQALMVGDDVEADVLGARDAGLQGVAVRTGKFRPGVLPEGVRSIASVAELGEWIESRG